MNNARRLAALALGAVLSAALVLLGCDRKPVPERPAPVIPEVKSSTPEEAAKSVLLLLQAELRAVARKDQATAEKCRELCAGLVARQALSRELKSLMPLLGEKPVVGLVTNWAAAIAAYSDDFDFEQMSVPEFTDAEKTVGVYMPATGRAGRADLRIECVRDGSNWLVGNIAFEGVRTIRIPVSAATISRTANPPAASAPARPQATSDAAPRP